MEKFIRLFFIVFLFGFKTIEIKADVSSERQEKNVISWVDTSLDGSQKYVLRVGGKPYFMINIQIRLDNMRYVPGWTIQSTESIIAQAASDGFNTVSIPVHWREVELSKNIFDWTILNEYMSLVNKYNLKMELLWFGANSGGHVQWLGRSNNTRTPDYVLYSPSRGTAGTNTPADGGSHETTSDYTILRDQSPYSLDIADNHLRERETFVLSKVMEHIAAWDAKNSSKHPIIGVQIGNEVVGYGKPFPNSLVISYLNDVAGAVKKSPYVVWTRLNCVFWKIPSRIIENEKLRNTPQGTNIDFVGIDTYRHHFETDEDFVASMRNNMPYIGKNFRMIMETNANIPNAATLQIAALSGNSAFDYYDFGGMYETSVNGVRARGGHVESIRSVNKILSSAKVDLALKAHGYGLYVHNWEGVKSSASTCPETGITFEPDDPTSHGISIVRNPTEIVLMTTKGGTFTFPDSLQVTDVSKGYFDDDNKWVKQDDVSNNNRFRRQSIFVEQGVTILLVVKGSDEIKPLIYQAEWGELGGGAEMAADIQSVGFAGNGYVRFGSFGGAYIHWMNVDGLTGGEKTIRFRYSHGGRKPYRLLLGINGKNQMIEIKPTGSWDSFNYFTVKVVLNNGKNNVISLETADNSVRVNRVVYHEGGGNIDELQIY